MNTSMTPYRRRKEQPAKDYAKTLFYVTFDLTVRILTAVGLVAIGIAGWMLQRDTQLQRAKIEANDRLARRYLPMYRTLTDLELTLRDCSERLLVARRAGHRAQELSNLAFQLEAAAVSAFSAENDLIIRVNLPIATDDAGNFLTGPFKEAKLPLRANAFMVADVMRLVAALETLDLRQRQMAAIQFRSLQQHSMAAVILPLPSRGAKSPDQPVIVIPVVWLQVRPETVGAWRAWNGDDPVLAVQIERVLIPLVQAVHQQAVDATQQLMRERPELGDQYVAIRRDAVAEQVGRRGARRNFGDSLSPDSAPAD
ncbi:MAG TPA: hypothetical protein VGF48_23770 [Thermoanaerobaculia bacterium]|jgi:hypothetical protein